MERFNVYLLIDKNSGVPMTAQIIDQIKYLVVSGGLAPGEQIPSVRGLAAELKVNPTTVARVYRQLESEEIIQTRRGLGTFVAQHRSSFTLTEKRWRLRPELRKLVVEAGRIGLSYEELIHLLEEEIEQISSLQKGKKVNHGGANK
jgi:GntR family transcriptional regulator